MKPIVDQRRATDPVAAEECRRDSGRLTERMRAVRAACRQVFGIPDYERYVAHMAAQHPADPVLGRREFFAQAIDRKYGRSGPRCC